MKNSNLLAVVFFLFLVLSGCKQHQDARRPISQSSGSFMKKSILRNKKLVATEESQIQNVIKNNPSVVYLASNKGYWYSYEVRNTIDNLNWENHFHLIYYFLNYMKVKWFCFRS